MPKEKSIPPLSDAYRKAWESCAALWPLFILRFAFLVLCYGALVSCLFLVGWPLIQVLWKGFKDNGSQDFARFVQTMDWSGYIPDPSWIALAVGLGLLFILWWSLLSALFDGAVYSVMRKNQDGGQLFSLREFFKDGLRYMIPMIGLQVSWFLIFIGAFLLGTVMSVMAAVLLHLLHIPWWAGLLLAIPGGFVALALLIAMGAWAIMSGAYLMEDEGVTHALKRAFQKCLEGHGRVIWGIFLVWIIYFVFSLAFQTVMNIFGAIPLLGLLFLAAEFIVSIFLSVAIWVFMPALAVSFSLEGEV